MNTETAVNWGELVNGEMGKPFVWAGRGDDSYDCWGLVLRVYRLLGWPCPTAWDTTEHTRYSAAAFLEPEFSSARWITPSTPAPGDVVVMGSAGRLHHAGVLTPFGVLHTTAKHGVVIANEAALKAVGYQRVEYRRWAA